MSSAIRDTSADLAVVGMSGRFPGAADVDELWRNLVAGRESVTFFSRHQLAEAGVPPSIVDNRRYVPARAVLDDVDAFDATLFGYNVRDAELLDPQQRLFLECAWTAVEHAGHDPARYDGRIGVYAGSAMSAYLLGLLRNQKALAAGAYRLGLANDKDHLTTRVAHKLGLTGPAVTVQTACSTSLVAVHVAAQALLAGECDMALAGGVAISLPQVSGYLYEDEGIMSRDGHCRAFDAEASGTVAGSGAGVVVLKRLADAVADRDTIHAVLLGSAVNNDGAGKSGYTAPSTAGQAAVIAEALSVADVAPSTIAHVEAHGTGTALGDPIEIAALAAALPDPGSGGIRTIGSIKTNLGHLDAAAGVAGLIKTVLALRHHTIPPSLHFERPNPRSALAESGFRVNTTAVGWPAGGGPRRAGVSSFGMGGTNAHVVLQEPPSRVPSGPARQWHVLTLSAASPAALDGMAARLAGHLRDDPGTPLADAAYTLQAGRRLLRHRRAVVCRDVPEALAALTGDAPVLASADGAVDPPVAFLFPGQGTQRPGMGADLYRTEPVFRAAVDRCADAAAGALGLDLRGAVLDPESRIDLTGTALAQPALFTVAYALSQLWLDWGVRPAAMLGHSLGEYVAACLADVFTPEDALELVVARGRLVGSLPPGVMLSVPLPEDDLRALSGDRISLAAVNGAGLGVLAGPADAIAGCEAGLAARGVATRRLRTSHAMHSAMLDPILDEFRDVVDRIPRKPPQQPYLSNVTGDWVTDEQATSARYWCDQMRGTVRFGPALHRLLDDAPYVLLEVGAGQTLGTLARLTRAAHQPHPVASLPDDAPRGEDVPRALAQLWLAGVPIDWDSYHRDGARHRIPLPGYPFERQRYWIAGPADQQLYAATPDHPAATAAPRPVAQPDTGSDVEGVVAGLWREMLGTERVGRHDSFLELGGHSLLAVQIVARLRDTFDVDLTVDQVFELRTVGRLSAAIEELLVARLESLTDDEVAKLLAEEG
jgi:acyl transferase domain-containing protein